MLVTFRNLPKINLYRAFINNFPQTFMTVMNTPLPQKSHEKFAFYSKIWSFLKILTAIGSENWSFLDFPNFSQMEP